jgi:geranylgeranyl diphosphate synthase type I
VNDQSAGNVILELARVADLVNREIASVVDRHILLWAETGGNANSDAAGDEHEVMAQYRKLALSGGKRLRPAFTFWAYEGAGGERDHPDVVNAALAVEMLHTFALIHDDVMDRAETRRSVDTIHVTYARRHEALGLRGDAAHYGNSVAILMGDLAFAHAAELMSHLPADATSLFFTMCADLMVGQYLDIDSAAQGARRGRSVAEQITELKTARYTVVNPLVMGATLAGRANDLTEPLTAYGRPVGHAFQLRDDILGAFGDPAVTGKPVGDDIAQGKVTALLELGIQLAEGPAADVLLRLGSPEMQADDPGRAMEILEQCGARAQVEERIEQLVDESLEAIRSAPIDPGIGELLADAAVLIAHRDH